MARYLTRVRTAKTPQAAFAYLANPRNFTEWCSGVKVVRQVEGSGGGPSAVFNVTVAGVGPPIMPERSPASTTVSLQQRI